MDSLLGDIDAQLEAAQEGMAAGRVDGALAYLQAVHSDLAEIASVCVYLLPPRAISMSVKV